MPYYRRSLAPQTEKTFWCKKKSGVCDGNGFKVEAGTLEAIGKSEVCQKSSTFENYYIVLTANDIQTLENGKVLAVLGQEHNIFVMMEE